MFLPFAKEVSSKRDMDILRRYFTDNLSEEDRALYEKETELGLLKRQLDETTDKEKWMDQHPEYEELNAQYGSMEVTKRIQKDIRKSKTDLGMHDEGFKDISDVQKAYDSTTDKDERKRLKKYLKEGVSDEMAEDDQDIPAKPKAKSEKAYDELATAEDLTEDYRMQNTLSNLKRYYDAFVEMQKSDPEEAQRMYERQRERLDGYRTTSIYRSALNRLKKVLGKQGVDDRKTLEEIRRLRKEWSQQMEELSEKK
jgi:hypothetical protein